MVWGGVGWCRVIPWSSSLPPCSPPQRGRHRRLFTSPKRQLDSRHRSRPAWSTECPPRRRAPSSLPCSTVSAEMFAKSVSASSFVSYLNSQLNLTGKKETIGQLYKTWKQRENCRNAECSAEPRLLLCCSLQSPVSTAIYLTKWPALLSPKINIPPTDPCNANNRTFLALI